MAYCGYSDLANAKSAKILANLTDDTNGAVVNNTIITALIEEADGIIDGYLISGGLTVPLSTVPNSVKSYSVRITIYLLYARSHAIPEQIQKSYDGIIKELEMIASGETVLFPASKSGVTVTTMYDDPKFTDDLLS